MLGLADLDGAHSLHRIPPVDEPSSAGRQAVNDALKLLKTWQGLSEQEQIVVKGYLDGNSFEAISKQFGVSRQRVQQVYGKALDKLDLTDQQRRDLSAAHRAKIDVAARERMHTPEARARIAALRRGTTHSPEARAKISAANKGRKVSAEARARMSTAQRGRTHGPLSAEHRARLSASAKARWARIRAMEPSTTSS
jgi:transposase